ncbi:MAG: hypothetical protein DHS20C18_52570 [Saprospiraceae bacterium]|nr:MAG: hypothetical protein DHS20C18_52570 [Saprospiraceae bacterium]
MLYSCTHSETETSIRLSPSFYHWQTELAITPQERAYLDALKIRRIYAKFFDVDWDGQEQEAVPHAQIRIDTMRLEGLEIIPTIFITNRTMLHLPQGEVGVLAHRINDLILRLGQQLPDWHASEVQIDCDWSSRSQGTYFQLLDTLRQLNVGKDIALSATIRLHQVRYAQETGIPPVDRGMLMFYNMGDLEDWAEPNSILNLKKAQPYLTSSYTLPLDLALPIFHWGVIFRAGRLIHLSTALDELSLQDTAHFHKIGPGRFKVVKSTYLDGYYLYTDDLIRLEQIDQDSLLAASRMLREQINQSETRVAFYHLDSTTIKKFPHENLQACLQELAEH